MKNLNPLRLNFSYFRNIARSKHAPMRAQLIGLEPALKKHYAQYVSLGLRDSLFSYNISSYAGVDVINLTHCYSNTNQLKKLKGDIYKNQEAHIRYECQYCMIGDSSESLDHYLPQITFPEFSVLSNNLIPCCSKCNSLKNDQWKDLGATRNIINFYYDPLPITQFLFCNVTFPRGTPKVKFTLNNPGTINATLYTIIERHYQRMGLTDRFEQKSNTEITNVFNTMTQLTATHNRAAAALFLRNDATQMKLSYGNNYWKAILKETIANSVPFLTFLGF
jgi:hypothetical protein